MKRMADQQRLTHTSWWAGVAGRFRRLALLALTLLAGWSGTALAEDPASAAIDAILQTQDARLSKIIIQSKQRPDYDVNVLDGGRRVQIDFQNTRFASTVQTSAGQSPVSKLTPLHLPDNVARLELTLDSALPVMVEPSADGYRIAFPKAAANTPATASPATVAQTNPEIADINFRRNGDNGGRLQVQISGGSPSPDVQRQDGRLTIDLGDTKLPGKLERRLDVTDFGTPVKTIDSYQRGRDTRLVFNVSGNFEYASYQVGNTLTVDIQTKAPAKTDSVEGGGKLYTGARFSMDFQAIDIRNALQVIADFTNLNVVIADNVTGTLTMRLKNVPWDQALDVILQSKSLGMKRLGNVIWVAPLKDLSAEEEARLKAEDSKRKLEPLVTEMIQINYANADDVASLLKASSSSSTTTSTQTALDGSQETETTRLFPMISGTRLGNTLLSERGAVTVDKRTNALLVKETPTNINNIKKLVAQLDRPVRQIMIESRIVIATTSASRSMGIKWGGSLNATTGADFPYKIDLSGGYGASVSSPSTIVNFPAIVQSGTAATIGVRFGSFLGDKILDLQLSALQTEGLGKVVSSPRVITADQQKATIEQGKEIPYQSATSSGATAVSFKKAVMSLEVTPRITPDGKVNMEVQVSRDSKGEIVPGGVAIDTRRVNTKILVNNGDTAVIGGIYEEEDNDTVNGVPWLMDLPIVGHLFKNKFKSKNQTELLIFLTPKVLDGPADDKRPVALGTN